MGFVVFIKKIFAYLTRSKKPAPEMHQEVPPEIIYGWIGLWATFAVLHIYLYMEYRKLGTCMPCPFETKFQSFLKSLPPTFYCDSLLTSILRLLDSVFLYYATVEANVELFMAWLTYKALELFASLWQIYYRYKMCHYTNEMLIYYCTLIVLNVAMSCLIISHVVDMEAEG